MAGLEFISMSHVLKFSSTMKSYPKSSCEFFLPSTRSCAASQEYCAIFFIAGRIFSKKRSLPERPYTFRRDLYLEVVIELVDVPHVPLDFLIVVLGILRNRVVGQVSIFVSDFRVLIILSRETNIALLVEPDRQRVSIRDHHPLSDVKLDVRQTKRVPSGSLRCWWSPLEGSRYTSAPPRAYPCS